MSKTLTTGMGIYIRTGSAVCQTSVATTGISGTITNETEKAIEVTAYTKNDKPVRAWLPKKAMKVLPVSKYAADFAPENTVFVELARWFKPTGWTDRWVEMTVRHAVL